MMFLRSGTFSRGGVSGLDRASAIVMLTALPQEERNSDQDESYRR